MGLKANVKLKVKKKSKLILKDKNLLEKSLLISH